MKTVFYLKDEPEFYQCVEQTDEIIFWVFRWNNKTAYSKALHNLIENNYTLN